MYIKAWRNKKNLTGSTRPRCGRGREGPCFAVCAVVCDPLRRAECVPAFTRESKRGPFVGEVEKRLGDKIYGGSFAGFSPSADVEGSQGTGKCMYIKAWQNQGLQMLTT